MTVDPQNVSIALHCANPSACPGGELAELHMPEDVIGGHRKIHLEDQVAGLQIFLAGLAPKSFRNLQNSIFYFEDTFNLKLKRQIFGQHST